MAYLVATYWMLLPVALIAGAGIGYWSATPSNAGREGFWLALRWTTAVLVAGLVVVMFGWLPEREDLYLQLFLLLLFCFIIGAAVAKAGRDARLAENKVAEDTRRAGEAAGRALAARAADVMATDHVRRAAEAKAAESARRAAAQARAAEDARRIAEQHASRAKAVDDAHQPAEAEAAGNACDSAEAETRISDSAAIAFDNGSVPQPAALAVIEPGHPGRRPDGLAAPRGGGPDDLRRIRGIGPQSEKRLHALGIWHFDQIAAWSAENTKWIGSHLALTGRVERDKWIDQAGELAAGRDSQFSRRTTSKVKSVKNDVAHGPATSEAIEPGNDR
jgi:predicted flap endonuclease-1-like 5' DNA nuclease